MTLLPDGPICGCGNRGCLEALASGPSIARRAREALATGRSSRLRAAEILTAVDVVRLAQERDVIAAEVWDETVGCRHSGRRCDRSRIVIHLQSAQIARIALTGTVPSSVPLQFIP